MRLTVVSPPEVRRSSSRAELVQWWLPTGALDVPICNVGEHFLSETTALVTASSPSIFQMLRGISTELACPAE